MGIGMVRYLSHPPTGESTFIDGVTASLEGVQAVVPPGSRISVRRYISYARINPVYHNILAAWHISVWEHGGFDTALVITPALASDSLTKAATRGRILWQNEDSMFHYYITCSM